MFLTCTVKITDVTRLEIHFICFVCLLNGTSPGSGIALYLTPQIECT